MAVLCPGCGTVNPEADAVCTTCGGDLAGDPVALVTSDVAPAATPRPKRSAVTLGTRRRMAGLASATLLIALAVAALVAWRVAGGGGRPTRDAEWVRTTLRVPVVRDANGVRVLGLGGRRSVVRVADLATGRVRELHVSGTTVSAANLFVRRDAIVVETFAQRLYSVRGATTGTARAVDLGRVDAVAVSAAADRFWFTRAGELTEVRTDGRVLARSRLPHGWELAGGGLDGDRVLLGATTDATSSVWDPRTGRFLMATRSAPALAATGRLLVSADCPSGSNPCRAHVTDLVTRTTRPLAAPTWDPFDQPALPTLVSPDGRFVAVGSAYPGHHGVDASITVVDTGDGAVVWRRDLTRSSSEPQAWDADGDLLFYSDGVDAFVHRVGRDDDADDTITLGPLAGFAPVDVRG